MEKIRKVEVNYEMKRRGHRKLHVKLEHLVPRLISLVRVSFHENIKFISSRHRVISSIYFFLRARA